MNKETVLKELAEDEKAGNGSILEFHNEGILYYDNENEETFYRFAESCTKEEIQNLMFISKEAEERGVTKDVLWDILNQVYGDYLDDAVCTLNGIFIISNEDDFYNFFDEVETYTANDWSEWYEYADLDNCCGKMFHVAKVIVVNEAEIYRLALELGDDFISPEEEYSTGVIQSFIHEMRHLMLETNCFFPEEIASVEENAEDAVEEFCRAAYEMLPKDMKILDCNFSKAS